MLLLGSHSRKCVWKYVSNLQKGLSSITDANMQGPKFVLPLMLKEYLHVDNFHHFTLII